MSGVHTGDSSAAHAHAPAASWQAPRTKGSFVSLHMLECLDWRCAAALPQLLSLLAGLYTQHRWKVRRCCSQVQFATPLPVLCSVLFFASLLLGWGAPPHHQGEHRLGAGPDLAGRGLVRKPARSQSPLHSALSEGLQAMQPSAGLDAPLPGLCALLLWRVAPPHHQGEHRLGAGPDLAGRGLVRKPARSQSPLHSALSEGLQVMQPGAGLDNPLPLLCALLLWRVAPPQHQGEHRLGAGPDLAGRGLVRKAAVPKLARKAVSASVQRPAGSHHSHVVGAARHLHKSSCVDAARCGSLCL